MISKESVITIRNQNVLSSTVDEQAILLNLEKGSYYTLDLVGADIWKMLGEPIAVDEIITRLLQDYDVVPEQVESDVLSLLTDLQHEGLIKTERQSVDVKGENFMLQEDKPEQQDRGTTSNSDRQNNIQKRGNFLSRIAKLMDRR